MQDKKCWPRISGLVEEKLPGGLVEEKLPGGLVEEPVASGDPIRPERNRDGAAATNQGIDKALHGDDPILSIHDFDGLIDKYQSATIDGTTNERVAARCALRVAYRKALRAAGMSDR